MGEGQTRYIVNSNVIPEVYVKVLEAKELLANKKVKDISQAVKQVGISRSVFYKYRDNIQVLSTSLNGRKVSLNIQIRHESGTLSQLLDLLAALKVNILTIFQGLPIHTLATVQMMLDISESPLSVDQLIEQLSNIESILAVEIQGIE